MSQEATRPTTRDVMDYIASSQFKLKYYELDLLSETLRQYIKTDHPSADYHQELHNRSMVYRVYRLYKRIFDMRLQHRDDYTITLNPIEVEVVQGVLKVVTHDNIIAAILYGKIHQKTL